MINSQPIPFTCPACGTEYKIVTIELRDVQQSRIPCQNCDALFPASEEHVVLPCEAAKRTQTEWQRPLTTGNGLKSVLSGRAKPLTRACADNTPAWAGFGLNTLRGLSFSRQNQKQRKT